MYACINSSIYLCTLYIYIYKCYMWTGEKQVWGIVKFEFIYSYVCRGGVVFACPHFPIKYIKVFFIGQFKAHALLCLIKLWKLYILKRWKMSFQIRLVTHIYIHTYVCVYKYKTQTRYIICLYLSNFAWPFEIRCSSIIYIIYSSANWSWTVLSFVIYTMGMKLL